MRKSLLLTGLVLGALGAVVVTAQSLGGSAAAIVGGCAKQAVAASSAELRALLKCNLSGTTIALKPGDYGRFTFDELKGLTLRSADPANPASFEAIDIQGGSKLTLSNLKFGGSMDGVAWRLQIWNAADVEVSDLELVGGPGAGDSIPGGIYVRGNKHVTIKQSRISQVSNGIRILATDQLTVSDNIIRDFVVDAIQASAASQFVVSGNYISNAHPMPGDHPDGVQIFTIGNQSSASDIVVKDNLIERGKGDLMQGVFVTDETGKNPFNNLQITNNIIIGTMYHGIMVTGGASGAVRENLVAPLAGQQTWIMLVNANPLVLEDNVSGDFIKDGVNLQNRPGKNRRQVTRESDAMAASSAWKARHFPAEIAQ